MNDTKKIHNVYKLIICIALCIPFLSAPKNVEAAAIKYWLYYLPVVDRYKLSYQRPTGSEDMSVHFLSSTGVDYYLDIPNPNGTLFLTCNGTYNLTFYDSSSSEIGSFQNIVTTKIKSPTCSSYQNNVASNDHNATVSKNGNDYNISWHGTDTDGGTTKVFHNDQLVQSGNQNTYTGSQGIYTIISYDKDGNEIKKTDLVVPDESTLGGGTDGTGENEGASSSAECATLICQCIENLKPSLNSIKSAIDQSNVKLDALNNTTKDISNTLVEHLGVTNLIKNELVDVNKNLNDIKDHLTPSTDPAIKDSNDYQIDINNYKPADPTQPFEDKTIYFQDQGSAAEPLPLPQAIEPNFDYKDDEGNIFSPQSPLVPDEVLVPDEELVPDQAYEIDDTDYTQNLRWRSEEYVEGD